MIVHTFAFRWKPHATQAQKDRALVEIRAMRGGIPGLLDVMVGVNVSPLSQGYELGGVMTFATHADLDAYQDDPVHGAILEWLVPLVDALQVDFEP